MVRAQRGHGVQVMAALVEGRDKDGDACGDRRSGQGGRAGRVAPPEQGKGQDEKRPGHAIANRDPERPDEGAAEAATVAKDARSSGVSSSVAGGITWSRVRPRNSDNGTNR